MSHISTNRNIPFKLSFRRWYLDTLLATVPFKGSVLDIGGAKVKKRGHFIPPKKDIQSWIYVNIDPETKPDYLCSAEDIPLRDTSFDYVLICEVLEHLPRPEAVLRESARLLRPGGKAVVSMPFLHPIHADPDDYQRWTPSKLRDEFCNAGYDNIFITPMGGLFAVIYDLLRHAAGTKKKTNFALKLIKKAGLPVVKAACLYFENRSSCLETRITTGYFVVAEKPQAILPPKS